MSGAVMGGWWWGLPPLRFFFLPFSSAPIFLGLLPLSASAPSLLVLAGFSFPFSFFNSFVCNNSRR
jgi:hypothetical protein